MKRTGKNTTTKNKNKNTKNTNTKNKKNYEIKEEEIQRVEGGVHAPTGTKGAARGVSHPRCRCGAPPVACGGGGGSRAEGGRVARLRGLRRAYSSSRCAPPVGGGNPAVGGCRVPIFPPSWLRLRRLLLLCSPHIDNSCSVVD